MVPTAYENRSAKEAATRSKMLVTLRDPLLVNPFQENSRDPITGCRKHRRQIGGPFRAARLARAGDRPLPRVGEAAVQGFQRCQGVTGPPARAIQTGSWRRSIARE